MTPDPRLIGHRTPYRRYDLVDRAGGVIDTLTGIRGTTLTQSAAATIKRGGSARITDRGQDIDWLNARIRPVYGIEGYGEWPLGVYLPDFAGEEWSGPVRRWDAQLLDVATVLDGDGPPNGYTLPAGTIATDAIRTLIASTGETAVAVTDSDKTLTTARVWEPGTSWLAIINELADAIGYFALATDGDGHHTVAPYVRPANRPIAWEFIDGKTCIYRPEFARQRQLSAPNHQLARTRGTADEPGLYVNVYNDDPDSPFSRVNRDGRTVSADPIDVDAADEEALYEIARRALIEATTPTSTVVIKAMPIPLEVNSAVRFRSDPAGIDGTHVVRGIEYDDGPLATYTLLEVVDL